MTSSWPLEHKVATAASRCHINSRKFCSCWKYAINVHASYVYWTVQHLDMWIKRDHFDVTCFFISLFNAQHVSDVNTSILRSLRLICWVISWVVLLWYDVCWCYVVVWLGWCGVVSLCRLKHCFSLNMLQHAGVTYNVNKVVIEKYMRAFVGDYLI